MPLTLHETALGGGQRRSGAGAGGISIVCPNQDNSYTNQEIDSQTNENLGSGDSRLWITGLLLSLDQGWLLCRATQRSRDQKVYVVIPEIPTYGPMIAVRQAPETDCIKIQPKNYCKSGEEFRPSMNSKVPHTRKGSQWKRVN